MSLRNDVQKNIDETDPRIFDAFFLFFDTYTYKKEITSIYEIYFIITMYVHTFKTDNRSLKIFLFDRIFTYLQGKIIGLTLKKKIFFFVIFRKIKMLGILSAIIFCF